MELSVRSADSHYSMPRSSAWPVIFRRVAAHASRLSRRAAAVALPVLGAAVLFAMQPQVAGAQSPGVPAGMKQPGDFPKVKLTVGMYLIDASVAANEADREQGLMYRDKLAPNEGMLFVFDENAGHCFWMKNTEIPLSIAFIRDDGVITDLAEMKAETTDNHCPTHNGRYALEMSKSWFAAKGIEPGAQITGLPQP
jgi:uncharacterized membrane protein (UPF0127 family)